MAACVGVLTNSQFWPFFSTSLLEGASMKFVMTALVSAFMLVSMPSFAGSHGGGKMDDKKSRLQQKRK